MSSYNPLNIIKNKIFETQNVEEDNTESAVGESATVEDDTTEGVIHDDEGTATRGRGLAEDAIREDEGGDISVERYIFDVDKGRTKLDSQRFKGLLAQRIYGLLQSSLRRSKYFSTVSRRANTMEDAAINHSLRNRAHNAVFKWCVEHGDHIHIVHDCNYANGSCRCFGKQFMGHRHSRLFTSQKITANDWKRIINYHFSEGRRVLYAQVGDTEYTRIFRRLKDLQSQRSTEGDLGNEGYVEACQHEDEILWSEFVPHRNVGLHEAMSEDNNETNSQRGGKRIKRSTKEETNQEQIESLILKICKVPLQDFITTDIYLSSKVRFQNTMSVSFRNALHSVKLKFYNMQLRDYKKFYEELTEMPYWDSHNRESFDNTYMSLAMSKKYLKLLLIWQFSRESMLDNNDNDDDDNSLSYKIINDKWKPYVYKYILNLMTFLDRRRGKQNTDLIISPPNAGKTLFMDLIRDYLINCGQMTNWNRNSSFPLQMCGYTRVIFWNEPNYESSIERNLLKLLGGDSLNINIKNQPDAIVTKTPIFVTSNFNPFPNSPEFTYRINSYKWTAAPFLKNTNGKKFHPLALEYIFNETENYFEDDIRLYTDKYSITNINEATTSSYNTDIINDNFIALNQVYDNVSIDIPRQQYNINRNTDMLSTDNESSDYDTE